MAASVPPGCEGGGAWWVGDRRRPKGGVAGEIIEGARADRARKLGSLSVVECPVERGPEVEDGLRPGFVVPAEPVDGGVVGAIGARGLSPRASCGWWSSPVRRVGRKGRKDDALRRSLQHLRHLPPMEQPRLAI
ncbi:hypothetical protein GCM10010176_102220 [Nonomuraea spiralis]|nr:hypothetical protein GCM10010176_102220 [Nonomuraea spiralis]